MQGWYRNLAPPIALRDAFWSTLSPLSLRSCKASEGAGGTEVKASIPSYRIWNFVWCSGHKLLQFLYWNKTLRRCDVSWSNFCFWWVCTASHCAAIDISSEFGSKATNETFHPTRGRGQFFIGRPSCANWVTQKWHQNFSPRFMSAGIFQEWKDLSKIASWSKILLWVESLSKQ